MPVCIASYNIHAAIGSDGLFNPDRIIAAIRAIDPDIIALQEVEHHRWRNKDLLDSIADACGLQAIAGPTMQRETRHYGNALLTRLPICKIERYDLSVRNREPRGAIWASLRSDENIIQVFATHLGLRTRERHQQMGRLLAEVKALGTANYVLLGDLNDWWPLSRFNKNLRRSFIAAPTIRSYPGFWPLLSLDRILLGPAWRYLSLFAYHSRLARLASDHLPIVARITSAHASA